MEPQRRLMSALQTGWFELGAHGPVMTLVALRILDLIARLLLGGPHALALRRWTSRHLPLGHHSPDSIRVVRNAMILAPRQRAQLFAMAFRLLEDWPETFVAGARAVGLASTHIRKRYDEVLPYAFAHAIDWNLRGRFSRDGATEAVAVAAVLEARGLAPTYRNMVNLAGRKRVAYSRIAEASAPGDPWGQGRYWKLTGVSAETKREVRIAAHRAGVNVSAWVEAVLRRELKLRP